MANTENLISKCYFNANTCYEAAQFAYKSLKSVIFYLPEEMKYFKYHYDLKVNMKQQFGKVKLYSFPLIASGEQHQNRLES